MFFCTVIVTKVCGQTEVIGHITAEVTESVHASSSMVTGFELKYEQGITDSLQHDETQLHTETLNLGAITINAGANMAYNIKLHEVTFSDNKGNCLTIEPVLTSENSDTLRTDGSQTLCLNGIARMTHGLASGRYEGSYMMVIVYN